MPRDALTARTPGQQSITPPQPAGGAVAADPAARAYLQGATRVARRPFLARGWPRTLLYGASSIGVLLAAAAPSAATLALAAAGGAAALVESGVWRRGTVWRDVLAGGRSVDPGGLVCIPSSSPARERGTVTVASPSPTLPVGAVGRHMSGQVGRLHDAVDEEDLRARLLAAATAIRAQGGTPTDMAELQRQGRVALAGLRTRRAVEGLHGPLRDRPAPARAKTSTGRAANPTTADARHDPPRRPRRRARREPDLDEDHAARRTTGRTDASHPATAATRGESPRPEARGPGVADTALTMPRRRSGRGVPADAGKGAPARTRIPSAEAPRRGRQPRHSTAPRSGDVDVGDQGPEAAAAAAAARVFAFLDEPQAVDRGTGPDRALTG